MERRVWWNHFLLLRSTVFTATVCCRSVHRPCSRRLQICPSEVLRGRKDIRATSVREARCFGAVYPVMGIIIRFVQGLDPALKPLLSAVQCFTTYLSYVIRRCRPRRWPRRLLAKNVAQGDPPFEDGCSKKTRTVPRSQL